MRYRNETKEKTNGVVYTPKEMAKYLARQMMDFSSINFTEGQKVYVLDPATGDGELLYAIIEILLGTYNNIEPIVIGYETDLIAANKAREKLSLDFPNVLVNIRNRDFLEEADKISEKFDFIIANPPYIRTQILGAEKAQIIAQKMKLTGRIDIYYAFLLYMKQLLSQNGVAGYITSNKFLTIKAGEAVREFMLNNYKIHAIVDFGDTRIFNASVLPCIVIFSNGYMGNDSEARFTSIYETKEKSNFKQSCGSIFKHINDSGKFKMEDGRIFDYQQGKLSNLEKGDLWVISSNEINEWLKKVEDNTWKRFADIGKIRVGIKTTADNVFIGDRWEDKNADLELLQPLITHRDAGQIISRKNAGWKVLYTHTTENGKKKAYNIDEYPKTKEYLESHYDQLSGRKYIHKANRNWYEIWVPQNPDAWKKRKIVFRDIAERPEFWLDNSGAIVNGDCYWIEIPDADSDEIVYLALAVANSEFIEKYYDAKFNTKLYSGKRRYMSQYVEQFPIPNIDSEESQRAISIVKKIIAGCGSQDASCYMNELNIVVNSVFGV